MGNKFKDIKHNFNDTVDNLLWELDKVKVNNRLSKFMTRPAYYGTSLEQKMIFYESPCNRCGYFQTTEFWDKVCVFPWDKPEEYDKAAASFLPCKEDRNEIDR